MKKKDIPLDREQDLQIMLTEYSLIKDLRSGIVSQIDDFAKFYFSLVSALGAIVALISQIFGTNNVFFISIAVLCLFQFILGLVTFNRIVEGHISIITYTRGLNRIRKYFVDISNIHKYLSLPINDDVPRFGKAGFSGKSVKLIGLSTAVAIINSVFFSILIGMVNLLLLVNAKLNFLISGVVLVGILSLHFRIYNARTSLAEKNYLVRYPSINQ